MENITLDGRLFARMINEGALNLRKNKSIVNDLNVFPVPDGDTGDNMFMTLQSGCDAITNNEDVALGTVSDTVARGMLLGARGNSGVILSRIFAGIAEGLSDNNEADVALLSSAFLCGVKRSYEAVAVSVEGTILTVFRDACEYAASRINSKSTFNSYFNDFFKELKRSLERTPELLQALKDAGVVDSGGAGLVYIFEGMLNAYNGISTDYDFDDNFSGSQKSVNIGSFDENSTLDYGYCTEFLLQLLNSKCDAHNFDIDAFTANLKAIGDSVVSFLDGTVVKVHIHTKTPAEVFTLAQKYGEFLTVKVENMTLQHNEHTVKNSYVAPKRKNTKKVGAVAVVSGEGIRDMFIESGVDVVVEGGQCMNPAVADLIDAFEKVSADTIIVLPNNSNVILTAKAAAEIYTDAEILVLESRNVGEGYSAMSMFDSASTTPHEMLEELTEAMSGVICANVCKAVRDYEVGGACVKEGEYIGICGDDILSNSDDINSSLSHLIKNISGDSGLILLSYGNNIAEADAENTCELLQKEFTDIEIVLINGGQPVYDYLLIVE